MKSEVMESEMYLRMLSGHQRGRDMALEEH